ncbi:MAG: autotransporter-associated beta strand repeat-containing protein, partial [Verrucomicrobiota bacterium]
MSICLSNSITFVSRCLGVAGAVAMQHISGGFRWLVPLLMLCCLVNRLPADQFGDFTYTDHGTSITITGYPATAAGAVAIPATIVGKPVTLIGNEAFRDCTGLTRVLIPASVIGIGSKGFQGCTLLSGSTFLGNAPTLADNVFTGVASGFQVYFYNGKTGFTTPTWNGYPAVNLGDPSSAKDILTFSFPGLPTATISGLNINVSAPYGTALTNTTPSYTLSALASGDPPSGIAMDFTNPRTYIVTAQDGSTQEYIVTVCIVAAFTSPAPPATGNVGTPYNHTCTASGTTPITYTVTAGALPNGLTLGPDGVIFGTPDTMGNYSGTITAANGALPDATQGFSIVIGPALPEIAVEQPLGTNLSDGSASINCGRVIVGNSSSPITFTVKNLGVGDLTGLAVTKDGTHANDFTVGSLGTTTLTSGTSTTLTVTFAPGATGTRTAAIHIASNDGDENPFDIMLSGTGTITPSVFTWAGAVTGNWNDATKWTDDQAIGMVPNAGGQASYSLNFNIPGVYTATHNLSAGFLLNQLNFGGSSATLAGNSLSFSANSGTLPQLNQNASGTVAISNPLGLAAELTAGGSGTGPVALTGVISGTGKLTKTGPCTVTLSAANTYAGATTINQGTLQLGNGTTNPTINSTYNIASGATLGIRYNSSGAVAQTWSKFTGAGTLALASAKTNDQAWGIGALPATFTGKLRIEGGRVYTVAAGDHGLGGATTVEVLNGGHLGMWFGGTFTQNFIIAGTGYGETGYEGALRFGDVGITTTLAGPLTLAGNATIGARGTGVISSTIAESTPSKLTIGTSSMTGTMSLTGTNTYSGGTTLSSGTLSLGSIGAIGTTGTITFNGGTLRSTAANTTDYSARFSTAASQAYKLDTNGQNVTLANALTSSDGTLNKLGTGTLTLTGANTYSGGTVLTGGTLSLGSSGALGTTGTITFSGGELQATAANTTDYSARFSAAASQAYKLDTNGQAITWASALTSSGGSITKSGSGTLTLSATNTYNGITTITDGVLQVGDGGTTGSLGSGTVTNNATLLLNRSDNATLANNIQGTGGLTKTGAGTTTLTGLNFYSGATQISNGTLKMTSNAALPGILTHRWSFNGNLNDSVGKSTATVVGGVAIGTNQVTLSGGARGNSYVSLGSNLLPTSNSPLTIEVWATQISTQNTWSRIFDFGSSTSNYVTMIWNCFGDVNTDRIDLTNSSVTTTRDCALQPYTLNREYHIAIVIIPNGSGTIIEVYKMDGNGNVLASDHYNSTWTLAQLTQTNMWLGHSQYAADNDANASYNEVRIWNSALSQAQLRALAAAGPDAILAGGLGGNSTLQTAAGTTLDLNGSSQQVAALTGLGGTITNSVGNASLITGGDNTSSAFSGTIQGATSLTKTGTGTLTLSGTNTYTGTTTVAAGTLQAAKPAVLPGLTLPGRIIVADGSILAVNAGGSGEFTAADITSLLTNTTFTSATSMLGIDTTNATAGTFTYASNITSACSLGKFGSGTLTLSGTGNTYSGVTTVAAGTLQVNGSLGAGAGLVSIPTGGTLGVGQAASIARDVTVSGGVLNLAGTLAEGTTLTLTAGTVNVTGPGARAASVALSVPGAIPVLSAPVGQELAITNKMTQTLGDGAITLSAGSTPFKVVGGNVVNHIEQLILQGGSTKIERLPMAAGLDVRAWLEAPLGGNMFDLPGTPSHSTYAGTLGYATGAIHLNGNDHEHFTSTWDGTSGVVTGPKPSGYQDFYTVEYRGKLYVPTTGSYRFSLTSDDGSAMWIDPTSANPSYGTAIVQNGGFHPMQQVNSEIITLTSGYHDIIVRYFENSVGNGLYVQWDPTGGTTYVDIPGANYFHGSGTLTAGLDVRAWQRSALDGILFDLPGLPNHSTFAGTLGYATGAIHLGSSNHEHFASTNDGSSGVLSGPMPSGYRDFYTVEYRGKLFIPATGSYRFALASDDGSAMWIDPASTNPAIGMANIQSVGPHGMQPANSGQMTLNAGYHDFIVRFYEVTSYNGLYVQWDPTGGTNFVDIPGTNFFHVSESPGSVNLSTTELAVSADSTLDLGAAAAATLGNLNLTAGTLAFQSATSVSADTITATATSAIATGVPLSLRTGNVTVASGKILTVNPPVVDGVTPTSLTKLGTGTLVLNGANTYSGHTIVGAGTLKLTKPTLNDASSVTLASGTKLELAFSGTDTVDNLIIGTAQLPAGIYNSSHETYGTYFTGTGSLTVLTSTNRPATSTTLALASGGNPCDFGASLTYTATVVGATPTGNVIFRDGAVVLGTVALNGSFKANLTTSGLASGAHLITARYAGDANNAPGDSTPLAQNVGDAVSLSYTFSSATGVAVTTGSYTASGALNLSLGFAPATGTNLMVVKNTGLSFITGTFSNLAQGQLVSLTFNGSTYNFVANYYGGTGNDLVLQWAATRPLAWGDNSNGQLGNSNNTYNTVPAAMNTSGVLVGKTLTALSAGRAHVLTLCADNSLTSRGYNGYGQLGDGSLTDSYMPLAVSTTLALYGKTVVAVAAGYMHSLALCSDGMVAACGYNNDGQLGNNSITNSLVPVAVNTAGVLAGKTVIAIAAGEYHSLALCSDGTLAAWGYGGDGQLGNNNTGTSTVPVLVDATGVLAGKTVVAIAAGERHNLALCADGTLAAWGLNSNGQLGINSTTNSLVPVAVNTAGVLAGKTIVAIATGRSHCLALCSDGTLTAWGYNGLGALGNNSTTQSNVPVLVSTSGVLAGKAVSNIAAGQYHSLALCTDGTLATWGYNNKGQLGNNSTSTSLVPVLVNTSALAVGERFIGITSGEISDFTLGLVAMAQPAPRIVVEQTGGTVIADGSGQDFGNTALGSTSTRTFTIRNAGTAALTGITVTKDGPHAGDFTLTTAPASTVAAGGTTTLLVTFSPSVAGARAAAIHIASNDVQVNPFDISLIGNLSTAAAIDQLGVTITDGGSVPWVTQSAITHDGVAAARSGTIGDNQESWLQMPLTVSGPGTLTYWCKVSSEANDYLEFYLDAARQSYISGETNWQQRSVGISTGSHTLKWRYVKNSSLSSGQDAAWLDEVTFALVPTVFTWASGTSGNWNDATKWTNDLADGAAPSATGRVDYNLNFNATGTFSASNNLNSGFLLNQLNLGGSTVTLSGNSLAFSANGSTLPQLNQNSASTISVSAPLSLASNLTIGGSGSGALSLTGVVSGSGLLTKSNASSVTLSGANTYTGGTTIQAGTLALGSQANTALGTGLVTLNSGTTLTLNRSTLANNFTLSGGTVAASIGDTLNGAINLAATSVMDTGSTGNLAINGNMSGTGGMTKNGSGTGIVVLNGTNTYTGPTTVNGGILQLTKPGALYNATEASWIPANISVASGATLRVNVGGASDFTPAQAGTLISNLVKGISNNGLKAGSYVGYDTLNAGSTVVITPNNITDSSGTGGGVIGLRKYSAGTLQLSAANTYTGKTYIESGTLRVASFNSVNSGIPLLAGSSLGTPSTIANGMIDFGSSGTAFAGGVVYTGTGETTDRSLFFAGSIGTLTLDQSGSGLLKLTGTLTFSASNSKAVTLQGSTAGTGEIAGNISNGSGATTALIKNGTSIWTLSGSNTYTAVTTVTAGVLLLNSATALPGGIGTTGGTSALTFNGGAIGLGNGNFTRSLTAVGITSGVNFTGNGGWAAYGADRVVNLGGASAPVIWAAANTGFNSKLLILGAATATHTVDLQNPLDLGTTIRVVQVYDGTAAIDGKLSGNLTGSAGGGLLKTGNGALVLTGSNTYIGDTYVVAGTLVLAEKAGLKFVVTNAATNRITDSGSGLGTVILNGAFTIDTTAVTAASGSWNLVDCAALAETFGPTFTIAGGAWTEAGNVWTRIEGVKIWTFTESTGTLTLANIPPPSVTTGTVSGTTAAVATLSGTVNPNGLASTALFKYGLSSTYGQTASVTLSPSNGLTDQNISAGISGLQAATTYHYCLFASNPIGTGWGEDKTFTTYPQVPYTYISANGKITITDYTGPGTVVNIPSTINGLPVTTIGSFAFYNRADLTSITLPASVTSIEDFAFYWCTGLTNMTLPAGLMSLGDFAFYDCSSLTGITIPGGVIDIGSYAFALCDSLASVRITNGVLSIGEGTFYGCAQLTQVTIPASITSIGQSAFAYCSALLQASFTGNAPAMGKSVFDGSASGFTVDYFGDKTGFTSPKWLGYATFSMVAGTPFATWLVEKSLPYNANPLDDPNGDGVNLLMAYALNLEPAQDLNGKMPQAAYVAGRMGITFYAGRVGVTYIVESSTNLVDWTSDNVTISAPDANQVRTASVAMTVPSRYLRLR